MFILRVDSLDKFYSPPTSFINQDTTRHLQRHNSPNWGKEQIANMTSCIDRYRCNPMQRPNHFNQSSKSNSGQDDLIKIIMFVIMSLIAKLLGQNTSRQGNQNSFNTQPLGIQQSA